MQLTSTDETDLLLPLYGGVHDRSEWVTFLTRIRHRTGADYASLIFAQGETPIHLSSEVFSGRDLRAEAREKGLEQLYEKDRLPYDRLRPGRVYDMVEFVAGDPVFREFHETFNRELRLRDERMMRIKEQEGTSAWLAMARGSGTFSGVDAALLAALAPHVAIALRSFVLAERDRIRAAASREGLARSNVGWIALSHDARLIDIEPQLARLLGGGGESPVAVLGERLLVDTPTARQTLIQTAQLFARAPDSPPRALRFMDSPRLDALLVPMRERPQAALALPVMLVLCRLPRDTEEPSKSVRGEMLGALFGLSRREAELALAIAEGHKIGEAAAAMGLTEETARGYSKAIYAKTGTRGQVELMRILYLSSSSLS